MIIGGYEFSEKCPENCPGRDEPFSQGGLCSRCPIFNCVPVIDEDGFLFSLLQPDEYREDWAREWKNWFDSGMDGYPYLPIEPK